MSFEKDANFDGLQAQIGQLNQEDEQPNKANDTHTATDVVQDQVKDTTFQDLQEVTLIKSDIVSGSELRTTSETVSVRDSVQGLLEPKSAELISLPSLITLSTSAVETTGDAPSDITTASCPPGNVELPLASAVPSGNGDESPVQALSEGQNSPTGKSRTGPTAELGGPIPLSTESQASTDTNAARGTEEQEDKAQLINTASETTATKAMETSPTISNPSIPGHKKFISSLNVHKKFLEKTIHAPPTSSAPGAGNINAGSSNGSLGLGSGSTSVKNSTTATGVGPARFFTSTSLTHSRLVTGKLSPSLSPPVQPQVVPSWARTSPVPAQPLLDSNRKESLGLGRGHVNNNGVVYIHGSGRGVWAKVPGTDTNSWRSEGEFPTAAEAAKSKMMHAQSIKKAMEAREAAIAAKAAKAAAANAHLMEGLDTFRGVHLDPNVSHWDEMDDDGDFFGDVVEFGDGTLYQVSHPEPNGESHEHEDDNSQPDAVGSTIPSNMDDSNKDEFDRTWPSRNKETKSLFNERLGKFEPWTGGNGVSPPKREESAAKEIMQKPKSDVAPSSTSSRADSGEPLSHISPRPWAASKDGSVSSRDHKSDFNREHGRDPPPHRDLHRDTTQKEEFTRDRGYSQPRQNSKLSPKSPPLASDRPLPPHLASRVNIPSTSSVIESSLSIPHNNAQTEKQVVERHNPPLLSSASDSPIPAAENLDDLHHKSMMSAAERARKRRQEEEAIRAAEKERAMQKAREIEERLRLRETPKTEPVKMFDSNSKATSDRPWRSLEKPEPSKAPITILKSKDSLTKQSLDVNLEEEEKGTLSWRRPVDTSRSNKESLVATLPPPSVSTTVAEGKGVEGTLPRPKTHNPSLSNSNKLSFKGPELSSLDLVMSRIQSAFSNPHRVDQQDPPVIMTLSNGSSHQRPLSNDKYDSTTGSNDILKPQPSTADDAGITNQEGTAEHFPLPLTPEMQLVSLDISTCETRSASPRPFNKPYTVRLTSTKRQPLPIPYAKAHAFHNQNQPSAVHSQTWYAGKLNVSRYLLRDDRLFAYRKFIKGVPQTVVKLPISTKEYKGTNVRRGSDNERGNHPHAALASRGRGRGESILPARSRAMEMSSWRRPEPLASPSDNKEEKKIEAEFQQTDVASAPPSNSLFETPAKPQKEKSVKSKLPEGLNVGFYRDSTITGQVEEEKSTMFMVSSEINGTVKVEEHVDPSTGDVTVPAFTRPITPPSITVPTGAPSVSVPSRMYRATKTDPTQAPFDKIDKTGNSTWNRNMSDKIKNVWSHPKPENENHENSLKGIADDYPSASFPSSVDQLKSDDEVEETSDAANKDLDAAFSNSLDSFPRYGPPPSSYTYNPASHPPPPVPALGSPTNVDPYQRQQAFNQPFGHGSHAGYPSQAATTSSNMLNSYSNASSTAMAGYSILPVTMPNGIPAVNPPNPSLTHGLPASNNVWSSTPMNHNIAAPQYPSRVPAPPPHHPHPSIPQSTNVTPYQSFAPHPYKLPPPNANAIRQPQTVPQQGPLRESYPPFNPVASAMFSPVPTQRSPTVQAMYNPYRPDLASGASPTTPTPYPAFSPQPFHPTLPHQQMRTTNDNVGWNHTAPIQQQMASVAPPFGRGIPPPVPYANMARRRW